MKRKILTLLLALAMVLTMLPMTALAAEPVVTITEDNVVYDGNETGVNATITGEMHITGSNVTVKNVTFADGGKLTVNTNGSFTLTGCTFNSNTEVRNPVSLNVGEATVTGNTFNGTQANGTPSYYNAIEFAVASGNKLRKATLSNNTFEAPISNNYFSTYYYDTHATIIAENNTIKLANRGSNAIRISNYTNSEVTFQLNNNKYEFSSSSAPSIYEGFILLQDFSKGTDVQDFSKVTININNLTAPADAAQLLYVYDDQDGIISTNQPVVVGDSSIEKFFAAKIENTYYSTLNDAYAAANDGDTVTLLKDVQLSSYIEVKKNITLDLGGKKLSRDGGMLLDIYSAMTIKNGEIEMSGAPKETSAIWVNQTANLTLDRDATVTALPLNGFGIAYYSDCTTAEVTLKGTLKGGNGITMNGTIKEGTSNKLTVDGATIAVNGHGIYQAGCSETNFSITDSTISGTTGIEVRAGKLTISNSKVTATGAFNVGPNSNGTTTDGAAIAIAQHTTKHPIDVTISGGEFSGEYAIYESNPQKNDADSIAKVKLTVNGGKFDGKIFSEDLTKFIYAGYFTEIPAESYLAPGKAVYLSNLAGYDYMVAAVEPATPVTPSEPAVNPFNENAGKNSVKFGDVADNAWYASAVNYAVDKGLMNGTGEGKFSPEADTTRGMIVTILARLDGKNTSGSPWYQAGQRWAMEYEISDGTNMTGAITREQLVTMLFRYAVKNGLEAVTLSENLTQFTDASDISAWAIYAMQWAVGQGLIQGSNGQLRPQANASRAEVATILMRFCELMKK